MREWVVIFGRKEVVMVQGRCLCGTIAYDVPGEPRNLSHCHCSMCRKAHGSAFASYYSASAQGFRWLSGEDQVQRYQSSPGGFRPFCPRCGSVAPFAPPGGEHVFAPAGNLDGDPGIRPSAHIFVASKAPWYEIPDEVPRFDVYPPEINAPELKREPRQPETARSIGGSCLCGEVAFELSAPPEFMIHCHCSRCRRARSAAHATNVFVPEANFRWIRGEDRTRSYKLPEAERFGSTFCTVCGSAAPRAIAGADRVLIPCGVLDQDPGARPRFHIYAGSKAPWFEIADSLPQFEEGPQR